MPTNTPNMISSSIFEQNHLFHIIHVYEHTSGYLIFSFLRCMQKHRGVIICAQPHICLLEESADILSAILRQNGCGVDMPPKYNAISTQLYCYLPHFGGTPMAMVVRETRKKLLARSSGSTGSVSSEIFTFYFLPKNYGGGVVCSSITGSPNPPPSPP